MEQQDKATQEATTILIENYSTDSGSDWEFQDTLDTTGMR